MKYAAFALILALAACAPASKKAEVPPAATAPAAGIPAGDYRLDPTHASLVFRVNHIGFSNYTARFTGISANLALDPADPAAARLEAVVDASSLALDNPPPGFLELILGPDWLDSAGHPEIRFHATKIELTAPDKARVSGELTLKGATKPVAFEARFNGGYAGLEKYDPQARIGFSAYGSLNRSDFGVSIGIPEPGSTVGVSDKVEFLIEAEFLGPPLAAP
ncbi:MAG: YceI family protein [Parvularculaceae bacterium]